MDHSAEILLHLLLQDVAAGRGSIDEDILDQVAADVKDALRRQISREPTGSNFRLRVSNLGRPRCQLWFDKNKPEAAAPRQPFFLMQMLIGDVTEAVFKGLLRAAAVDFTDTQTVVLHIEDSAIKGSYDLLLDGKVDDIKSASPWSYKNKFDSFDTLAEGDSFGYVAQLVAYAEAAGVDVGGWWVINKSDGAFKYVTAESVNKEEVLANIANTVRYVNNDEPFERCFEAEDETFFREPTGNKVLPSSCRFCDYKKTCWPELRTLPKLVVKPTTKTRPDTDYVYVAPEYKAATDG
jgi:hypothetical protein